jgi:hypothetical protein
MITFLNGKKEEEISQYCHSFFLCTKNRIGWYSQGTHVTLQWFDFPSLQYKRTFCFFSSITDLQSSKRTNKKLASHGHLSFNLNEWI